MATPSSETKPAAPARAEPSSIQVDEERLAHALVSRGLVTKEEVQACRVNAGTLGPEGLLKNLVKAGSLTLNQARRAAHEISALLHQQIPGYELIEKLGNGSMGTVYKARQLSMNRMVAVKMLHPRLAAKQELLQRLEREAHLAGKLSHNNLVQAIDFGTAGSLHYFVMEYIEGTTIKDALEKGKIYSEAEALDIVLQVAQALQHANRRGLIHRDVKPANIILTPDGAVKLADLGMARETTDEELARAEKGMTIGTPYYISTEQIHGHEDIDARADIYSLGATLYHMVTGQPPFPGSKIDDVLDAHLKQELTPPDHLNVALSSGLGEVVEVMMAKDRRQRYKSMDDVIIDLECLVHHDPPKLARSKIQAGTLQGLAEGEEEEEDGKVAANPTQVLWLGVLGTLLGASLLVNLILLFRRG
ncbi:MAG TPA: serine/threonine-protein kinase [Gemmataceae bacterium]|nr:serine/threonine-protein kinase [Gemmataceae bacterium]